LENDPHRPHPCHCWAIPRLWAHVPHQSVIT